MDRIWAPWRKAYIRPSKRRRGGCLFCRLLKENADRKNYILKRTLSSFAILNLYPYNNGHTLVLPMRHVDSLDRLTDREKLDLLDLYENVRKALRKTMKAQGFNVGMNLGRVGGAGVPHHLHLHIVPRWSGDSNFMPVLGNTKIISESLRSVYEALLQSLEPSRRRRKSR